MFERIISDKWLGCSVDEFTKFINGYILSHNSVWIILQKYKFSDQYNWVYIENIFWNEDARYYVLSIQWWNTYLQTHIPFVDWIQMITDDNFDDVSKNHCDVLSKDFIYGKALLEAISFFTKEQTK